MGVRATPTSYENLAGFLGDIGTLCRDLASRRSTLATYAENLAYSTPTAYTYTENLACQRFQDPGMWKTLLVGAT